MNFRTKKLYLWFMLIAICAVLWYAAYWNINHKFHYEIKEIYEAGDCFTENDCEIKIQDIRLMSTEELAKACENLTIEDIEENGYNGLDFCVVDTELTNVSDKDIDTKVYLWIIECGGYGNGCSWLTDLNEPEIHNFPAGETKNVQIIFTMSQEGLREMEKHKIKIYTSLYPEVKYISYETNT